MKTPAEQALSAAYTSARSRLPGKGAVASLREDAFKRFEERGLPHRRVEEWKYTDLRALMRDMAPLAGAPDAAARAKAKEAGKILAGVEMRRIVFVDGAFAPELSDLTPEPGLTIGSLADALAKGGVPALGTAFSTDDVAVALNTALMGDGAVIDVAAHARIRRPIHLVFAGTGNSSAFVRSLVTIGEGAEVTLIEDHDSGEAQVNAALELIVGDHARVEYFKLTQAKGLHVASLLARIGADAHFNSFAYTAGSPLVRNQSFIRFDGERTHAGIRGVNLLRGKDHVDTTLLIVHAKGHCVSREQFKTVLDGESHGVFQGKIVVAQHAQKTDAKMMTRALLLSEDAEADNKPELEIFADDVVCGHGATAGALDPGLKFYLMSRGISDAEAEALLIQAFIGETVEEIAHEGIREALMNAAIHWLRARAA
ncbi:MAG TPA: Fe-S cluster assembly protein SufD [Pseudolabrys sp.]|uniref:Fe-S cluster assembly protein SufD n=1 Tax=Pseudolabrys sp. TaxID=1960880 RepID=UPI002DDCE316|nr:Fe-S cluster assembly protein SufD [Pseudolabrys sp.]HEV2627806.1 Fe-S cluster assembly protein SufD [Pseudolabrys sp.]